jgi:hypothetical protein
LIEENIVATQREIFDLPSDGGRFYIKVVSAKRGRTLGKRGILVLPAGRTETGKVLYCYRRYI